MTRHTKQAIIVSVIILLVLCAASAVFAFRTDIQCLWWYMQCRTLEKDNKEYKYEVVDRLYNAKAIRILCWMLTDDDAIVRWLAVEALSKLGDKRAVEPLIVALKDENKDVRWHAAMALGDLGDKRAVEPLIAALKDTYVVVRWCAVIALGEIGDRRAIEALNEVLVVEKDEFAHYETRKAIKKLESLPDKP